VLQVGHVGQSMVGWENNYYSWPVFFSISLACKIAVLATPCDISGFQIKTTKQLSAALEASK